MAMVPAKLKPAYILSLIIVALTIVASGGGLFIEELYRDNYFVSSGWYGNDLVTLFVAVSVLVVAMVLVRRGSLRAQLVWLGMLDYTLYNFAFYLFGTTFNRFFMVYELLFVLSIFALIFGLTALSANNLSRQFRPTTPVKWISGYMLFVALGLTVVYVAQYVSFIQTGQLPAIVTLTEHTTNVVFALDLSLVIPWYLLGAVWLWQRRPWGYVIAAVVNIKGTVYMLALSASTITVVQAGVSDDLAQLALWGFIGVASLIVSFLLLRNLNVRKFAGEEVS